MSATNFSQKQIFWGQERLGVLATKTLMCHCLWGKKDTHLKTFYFWFRRAIREGAIKPGIKLARDTFEVNKKRNVYKDAATCNCCTINFILFFPRLQCGVQFVASVTTQARFLISEHTWFCVSDQSPNSLSTVCFACCRPKWLRARCWARLSQ